MQPHESWVVSRPNRTSCQNCDMHITLLHMRIVDSLVQDALCMSISHPYTSFTTAVQKALLLKGRDKWPANGPTFSPLERNLQIGLPKAHC